jgi:hypothetical protein
MNTAVQSPLSFVNSPPVNTVKILLLFFKSPGQRWFDPTTFTVNLVFKGQDLASFLSN